MRGFVALVRREVRDLRWHFRTALFLGAATPWAIHGFAMDGAGADTVAAAGGRVIVPLVFGLFAAATASDLISREVATRRIDALAALPVPISRIWAAKFTVLLATSAAFLVWAIAADYSAIVATCPQNASDKLLTELAGAIPTLSMGLAFGMASLFFSTLVERGMSAAFAAIVAIVGVAAAIEFAEMPATRGPFATAALFGVPVVLSAAFAAASYRGFVRGPIHGPSKLRVAAIGLVTLAVVTVPASAALAFGLGAGTEIAPDQGYVGERGAYLSPNGRWVAVMNQHDGVSRTWIVGVQDGSCRPVVDGHSWIVGGNAWLPGSVLRVWTSSFSIVDGPLQYRDLEIEPVSLGVMDSTRVRSNDLALRVKPGSQTLEDGRRVVCEGEVTLRAADGTFIRQLFPPPVAGKKGN